MNREPTRLDVKYLIQVLRGDYGGLLLHVDEFSETGQINSEAIDEPADSSESGSL